MHKINNQPFSADFGDHYTSVLWVSAYAPKMDLLKKSLWKNFEPSYYRIGARYYDGDIGLWISVDPARQFWSPYVYVGNGFNPVNGVDPDGNKIEIIGSDQYRASVNRALYSIAQNGPNGKGFVKYLMEHEKTVTIHESADKPHASTGFQRLLAAFKIPTDVTVFWDGHGSAGSKNHEGGTGAPDFVVIAHELGHAEEFMDGNVKAGGVAPGMKVPKSEQNAILRENEIREEAGIPYRDGY